MSDVLKKVRHVTWFSSLHGSYGIVVIQNKQEMKAYLGSVINTDDRDKSIEEIVKWGAKFPLKEALSLCGVEDGKKE